MSYKKYKFKFSIIIAIYNMEKYLRECIESVIEQKGIDFVNSVQLILVNDGSNDKSHDICLKFKELYPNNVVYIEKENEGVSETRNKGLEVAEGKYVNFLDADDKLDSTALGKIYNFFNSVNEKTDIVTIPIYFFDRKRGTHPLNYKYSSNRVIDLQEEFNKPQLSSSSSFVKLEIAQRYKFDKSLKYGEDVKYLNQILLERCTLGVYKDTKYFYRKRLDETSAIDRSKNDVLWYTYSLDTLYNSIINYSIEKKGYLPKFIQYLVMYDLQWKLKTDSTRIDDFDEYKLKFCNILGMIDDDIIITQNNMYLDEKFNVFYMKYGDKLYEYIKTANYNNKIYTYIDNGSIRAKLFNSTNMRFYIQL